jgi:transposase
VSRLYNEKVFVRKKKNKSGTVSIQIIDKSQRSYRVAETVGSSSNPDEIERLMRKARSLLYPPEDIQPPLFATLLPDDVAVENFLDSVKSAHIRTIGPELIFGALFDRIGFGEVKKELFRHLVIARLAFPTSKLKTVDYLYRYRGITTHEDAIYRFLDTLNKAHKKQVERIAYQHTKKTLGTISVVFYDMTTLYFEVEDEDDLRKIGYSKDGKFQHPQIMIGLLVGDGGFPIGYDIFEGNTFEGHTLVPTLEKLSIKCDLGKPVVIADAAMLSNENLKELADHGYTFIVGGRIKNESAVVKAEILKQSAGMKDGESFELLRADGTRLMVAYKDKRANKDRHNREKGVRKLRERVKSGKLTKEHINNRGYNKFLALEGHVTVAVDEDKIYEETRWDGLKGYVTNTAFTHGEIVQHYGHLWQIEKAFRISKTDLRVRPIFHYRKRRIEAHLCIAFTAYSIWKELELLLRRHAISMSPRRAAELTQTMYELAYTLPQSKKEKRRLLAVDADQQILYEVVHKT